MSEQNTLLFCAKCKWVSQPNIGMKNECPECHAELYTARFKNSELYPVEKNKEENAITPAVYNWRRPPCPHQWISVREWLPEDGMVVLCQPERAHYPTVGYRIERNGMWFTQSNKIGDQKITHWMPLPEPPKEEV